jgi:hypothetical protein
MKLKIDPITEIGVTIVIKGMLDDGTITIEDLDKYIRKHKNLVIKEAE